MALLEVVICSDYPTQLVIGATLAVLGLHPEAPDGSLQIAYVATLSLVDTLALVGLVFFFLMAHGERPRTVLFGTRPIRDEIIAGIPLALVALGIVIGVLGAIQLVAPALHTVAHNPLQDLLRSRRDTAVFALVVVVAGGVREEIQRAFLLHRFDRWLGGGVVGVAVVSVVFGSGHLLQGVDAAVATGTLGAFWGIVYLRRRSAVAPMVSHAGFNLLQLAQFFVVGR